MTSGTIRAVENLGRDGGFVFECRHGSARAALLKDESDTPMTQQEQESYASTMLVEAHRRKFTAPEDQECVMGYAPASENPTITRLASTPIDPENALIAVNIGGDYLILVDYDREDALSMRMHLSCRHGFSSDTYFSLNPEELVLCQGMHDFYAYTMVSVWKALELHVPQAREQHGCPCFVLPDQDVFMKASVKNYLEQVQDNDNSSE